MEESSSFSGKPCCLSRSVAAKHSVPINPLYYGTKFGDRCTVASLDSKGLGRANQVVWGWKSPSEVQGRNPGGGLEAKPPEAEEKSAK